MTIFPYLTTDEPHHHIWAGWLFIYLFYLFYKQDLTKETSPQELNGLQFSKSGNQEPFFLTNVLLHNQMLHNMDMCTRLNKRKIVKTM